MADVLSDRMSRHAYMAVVAVVAAYKSLEHLALFGIDVWWKVGALLAVGAAGAGLNQRLGMACIAGGALLANLTPAYRNHVHLLMLLALTLALFTDPRTERWVLRCQLSVMYAFATLAKLDPDWLDGTALVAHTWVGARVPTSVILVLAVATIVVEGTLALAAWLHWSGWFWLAVVTHGAFACLTRTDAVSIVQLAVFGILVIATWARATPSGAHVIDRIAGGTLPGARSGVD